jgi:cytochrome c-type biogenesis protein CcmF
VIAPLGRTLILAALAFALGGTLLGFVSGRRRWESGWRATRACAYLFAAMMAAANGVMVYALLARDFSVGYVAEVGSRAVPDWVAAVSLWSSLEGSILFWGFVLGAYVGAGVFASRREPTELMPYATAVWLACGAFFAFLLAGGAQPFHTMSPVPDDGPGPNPLLQNHALMIAHPPCLYLGYVGMTIPFGLASAALLTGRLGPDFVRRLRMWLLFPWTFLTVAIVLGGWWAYEVLGWGGYWSWDPVENASLLPWLTATAALHSAILMERKGVLKAWTLTLVLATFLLTILGTFMTRSGVFNSVHSFTQSTIGPTLLAFLAAGLVWSVVVLAFGIDRLRPDSPMEAPPSRDLAFLVNNLLFVLFTFTVLLGTVFPLVVEAMRGVQMSVGRPYFDSMSVPVGVSLLLLMGVGPALPWGRAAAADLRRALLAPAATGLVLGGLGLVSGVGSMWTVAALACGGLTAHVTLREMWRVRAGRRRLGGYIVHAGAVLIVVAIAVSSTMVVAKEVLLKKGESFSLGGYSLTFLGSAREADPHRRSLVAQIAVSRGGRTLETMTPRMTYYGERREPIGTPDVRTRLTHDLYLSVLSIDPDTETLGLSAMIQPMVACLWLAAALMGLGGLFALIPVRRNVRSTSPEAHEVPAVTANVPAMAARP